MTFLRKWIIWFWSAKLLWNDTAVASENSTSAAATRRVRKPAISRMPPPSSTATATAKASGGKGNPTAPII